MFQDESQLWRAFQQGDIRAFELVYQTHASALLTYGKRISPDHQLVRDLAQDIFVELWTRRQTLPNLDTIRYYLFRIMRNKLARAFQHSTPLTTEEDLAQHADYLTPSIEHLILQRETDSAQQVQLQQAISQLPDRQREVILLAFFHNFSNEQIAGIMGIHHQSVINHLNRALAGLRRLLHQFGAAFWLIVSLT